MENRLNRLPTAQEIKKSYLKLITPFLVILALSPSVKPANAQEIQNAVNSTGENTQTYSVPAQTEDNPDWVMEDIQACTYKSGPDWKLKSSVIIKNAGLVPALSNTASISVDANSYNRATNSIFYYPVPALESGLSFSINGDQVIYSGCDNECPTGVRTQFDVNVSGLPDNYENNHQIVTVNTCEEPGKTAGNLVKRAFLPSVQR